MVIKMVKGMMRKLALGTVIEVRKWKKAADVNLEGNKADEKADENVVKMPRTESSMRNKYQPKNC